MVSLFHALQSGTVKVFVKDEHFKGELETEVLAGMTASYPGDPCQAYVMNETTLIDLLTAEEVFMARQGISLEDASDFDERMEVDTRYNVDRFQSPSPNRFTFEITSDDGKEIEAMFVKVVKPSSGVKSLADAEEVHILAFDGTIGADGKLAYVEIHRYAGLLRPKLFLASIAEQRRMVEEGRELSFQLGDINFKFKPEIADQNVTTKSLLPGLGGVDKPTAASLLKGALSFGRAGVELVKAGTTSMIGLFGQAGNRTSEIQKSYDLGRLMTSRLTAATALMHVNKQEPTIIERTITEGTGRVRAMGRAGKRSNIQALRIDKTRFSRLISKIPEDLLRVFKSSEKVGYSIPGLILVRAHERIRNGKKEHVSAHGKCADEDIQRRATALMQDPIGNIKALAELVMDWGATGTKANWARSPVHVVSVVEPTRSPLPEPDTKTDRAP